ncbi:MAG: hypothetical protein HY328_19280, partial [Chloroflexi bacterium]|nr:hypothetical protein [Chloroflexota bacterium]
MVPGTGGGTFRFDYGYNEADQSLTTRYPGGNAGQQDETVSYTYNSVGQMSGGERQRRLREQPSRATAAARPTATGTGPYNHTYAYNAIGNLTSYAGNSYTYGSGKPHAVTAAYNNSYGYDAVGNQTSRTIGGVVYTFTYDYENRLTGI